MDVEEGLKFAEQLLNRSLKPLEVLIFQESWKGRNGKKYKEIAETYSCTVGNVNDAASDLWKLLSEVLGEPLRKNNFQRLLEKRWRSHSAVVPQRQEQAQEETASKNTDFVGREDAIANLTLENNLHTLLEKARLLQVSPDSIEQAKQAVEGIPSVLQDIEEREEERLRLQEKANKEKLNWIEEEKLKSLEKDLTPQEKTRFVSRDAGVEFQEIEDFFSMLPVDKQVFINICSALKLDWRKLTDIDFVRVLVQVVPPIRLQCYSKIMHLCGKLQVLYVSRPIELDALYVDVNILDNPPSYQWSDFSELPQVYDPETHEFDRLGLGNVSQPRIPGLLAIEKYHNLMVLGKPGSGKSTFLKHIAIQCNQGWLQSDRVPIFIGIKAFADYAREIGNFNLLNYIHQEFASFGITDSSVPEKILEYGRAIILLDGLDEVSKEEGDAVVKGINTFCNQYFRNKFIISCRISAQKHRFSNFKDIEISEFNLDQIKVFVKNWFIAVDKTSEENGIVKANQFIEQLNYPENQQLKAIAVTPILLTLTCLAFKQKSQFPSDRTSLYKRGIDALLIKWDESRGIRRNEVYRNLSVEHKRELLTQIAANTFENSRYFFAKDEIQEEIAGYIRTLADATTDSATLRQNSIAILESIEVQHGLLVERAQEVYSFSHLTFQEYFTAKKIKNFVDSHNPQVKKLLANITDKRWSEVFALSVDMRWKAEQLLFLKQIIDEILESAEELQEFLFWVQEKSNLVQVPYKAITIRAFYSALAFDLTFNSRLTNIPDLTYVCTLDNDFARDFSLAPNPADAFNLAHVSDFALDLHLIHKIKIANAGAPIDCSSLSRNCDFDPKLKQVIIQLGSQLPQLHNEDEDYDFTDEAEIGEYEGWSKIRGQAWIDELRDAIIKHRKIGHYWYFSTFENEELFRQYYYANKLLINCLNSASKAKTVSPEERSHIEDTLLLPIAEIEKRRFGD